MTDTNGFHDSAAALYDLIDSSSDSTGWSASAQGSDPIPVWQHDVVAKILAITTGQDILYLSLSSPDEGNWEIVVFTEAVVVHVLINRQAPTATYSEIQCFPRSSLMSLEIVEVDPLPVDEAPWPTNLNLLGRYQTATVALPLDRFASPTNKKDLTRLLASLLNDLAR